MSGEPDTIAAIATPPGAGGIGVVRVSGPAALDAVSRFFRSSRKIDLRSVASQTCHVGSLRVHSPSPDDAGASSGEGEPIDQVVVTVFRAPHSYTGEDVVEISAHGSPYVLQEILRTLTAVPPVRPARPGEFTQRAFLNGKMDLAQAEAVAELIHAGSAEAHRAALSQLGGALSDEVRRLKNRLLPLLAQIEVGLDHSDEDHEFLPHARLVERCREAVGSIDDILASARIGKVLRDGFHVAILGRPNAGKSSLLNALLREDRAIVTPVAGTTRDTLEERIEIDGVPVVLTDTAGLRDRSGDPVEAIGIERTKRAAREADLVLWVCDAGREPESGGFDQPAELASIPVVVVRNKIDLIRRPLDGGSFPAGTLEVSALTGEGLEALRAALHRRAILQGGGVQSARWLLNVRHQGALARARESLGLAQEAAEGSAYEEVVALELRAALSALGEIIGETTTEDLLDQIFSTFCIGK